MSHVAKLFSNGKSQAVRLPAAFRFEGTEVFISKDPETGNVILSTKMNTWNDFISALESYDVPDDFLNTAMRDQNQQNRDPFEGINE